MATQKILIRKVYAVDAKISKLRLQLKNLLNQLDNSRESEWARKVTQIHI